MTKFKNFKLMASYKTILMAIITRSKKFFKNNKYRKLK